MKTKLLYILLIVCLFFTACDKNTDQPEPEVMMEMPLSFGLPVTESKVMRQVQRRAMGDPGTTEQFLLPRYAYVFILKHSGEAWQVLETKEIALEAEKWNKQRYSGRLQSEGDSIYRYTENMILMLDNRRFNGRVYAIASYEELEFSSLLSSVEDLDDVLSLKFSLGSDAVQDNVQNIYSTPYNYNVSDSYYCSFSTIREKVPQVDLMLYHVAAKVDLTWSVEESNRINMSDPASAVRLTSLSVKNLYNGLCYCFRPMENTVASLPSSGKEIDNIVTSTSEGLWWEGRYYFYTIPFTVTGNEGYFPLQLVMRTNGSEGTGYRLTLNQPVSTASPFVPWIRGNINISQPLANISETKTIDD